MKILKLFSALIVATLIACGDSENNSVNPSESEQFAEEEQQGIKNQESIAGNSSSTERLLFSSSSLSSSLSLLSSSSSVSSKVKSRMTDERDGQTYRIIKVGSQVWMAENLRFSAGSTSHCREYFYYTWGAAMDSAGIYSKDGAGCGASRHLCLSMTQTRGVCPEGWHLPTKSEWNALFGALANKSSVYEGLVSVGFSINFTGYNGHELFDNPNVCTANRTSKNAFFWSATEANKCSAYYVGVANTDFKSVYLDHRYEDNETETNCVKNFAFPVRCVKDSPLDAVSSVEGSFVDSRDGQSYRIVSIGTQTWMAENLNYEMEGSSCYKEKTEYCTKYGRLYTGGAANKACPDGWLLPSLNEDWLTLLSAVGGSENAGKILKSNTDWNGSDNYGFSILPAGYYSYGTGAEPLYAQKELATYFWTSTRSDSRISAYVIFGENDSVSANMVHDENMLSVRCIQDSHSMFPKSSSNVSSSSKTEISNPKSSSSAKELSSDSKNESSSSFQSSSSSKNSVVAVYMEKAYKKSYRVFLGSF